MRRYIMQTVTHAAVDVAKAAWARTRRRGIGHAKMALKCAIMAVVAIVAQNALAVFAISTTDRGELVTTATGTVMLNGIRSHSPDVGYGTRDKYTINVPVNKQAVITVTTTGGYGSNTPISYLLANIGKTPGDVAIGPAGSEKTLTYTSSGKLYIRVLSGQYLRGGPYVSDQYFDSFSCKYSYRVSVEYYPAKRKVTFDANGGTCSSSTRNVNHGSAVGSLPTPTRDEYTFAGWYTSGGIKVSSTTTVTSDVTYYAHWTEKPKPDLSPYRPGDWSAPLVVATTKGAVSSSATTFTDKDNLYVNWAVRCSTVDVNTEFYIALYVDGVRKHRWVRTAKLSAGSYVSVKDYSLGTLSVGTHTIKIVADDEGHVKESNESNNAYYRTITVTRTPGSAETAAVSFTMPSTVVKYDVKLVQELISGSYSSSRGAFYATTTLSRGRLYTIAMPKASVFEVTCTDSKAVITYGFDDSLAYYLIDTRGMSAYSTKATLAINGNVGARASVYVVAADYMPLGNWDKPEVLPASSGDGQFRYDVTRNLRNGIYSFSLNAVAGMRYEMRVSGRRGIALNIYNGTVQVIDQSKGSSYHRLVFTCPQGGKVMLDVSANETGPMSVMWFGVSGSRKFKLAFDGNGGSVPLGWTRAAYCDKVGVLPVPDWTGHLFNGWYTAREGGTLVTENTVMTVATDITLYAHWTELAAGSCEDAAIGFAMTDSIATYNVSLTQNWSADTASYGSDGVLCCVTTVARGRFYTIAMPIGSSFDVECDDDGAQVTYGEDDSLSYWRVDTRAMHGDSAKVHLRITGDVGERVTVYAVAADYMPIGSDGKPEVLPADNAGKDFAYKVSRRLRNCCYTFSLTPVPDMIYELRVSGQEMIGIYFGGDGDAVNLVDCSDEGERASAYVSFSCPNGEPLSLSVGADTTGPIEVEWIGRRDKSMVRLHLDGNGGSVPPVGCVAVVRGESVGDLPEAERDGFLFDGWYTARTGGTCVTKDTAFDSTSDVTVYARWKSLVRGSCRKATVPFAVTANIRTYAVPLTSKWDDDEATYVDDGILCCVATVERGKLYTIAMPREGPYFSVECEAEGAVVSTGEDDALYYFLVDTRAMSVDSAELYLEISGEVGEVATVYAVAADCLPLGSSGKPEVLPARVTSVDGYFFYEVSRSLRNGSYDFKLDAIPGIVYELHVSGRKGLSISLDGDSDGALSILASSTSRDSAYALFSSPDGGEISISVDADETGPIVVEWVGTMACDDCYDTEP